MTKKITFSTIPQFPNPRYRVDMSWDYLTKHLGRYNTEYNLDTDPDFQRGHVWSEAQQVSYVEYILQDGLSGRDIFFNCPNWMGNHDPGQMVLVDGKQRLTAVLKFLDNKLAVFGQLYSEFEDRLPFHIGFSVHVNTLATRSEILNWYLSLNSGVAHTQAELDLVKRLLKEQE